ncbi:hypothetical protein HDU91_004397, partial [Kappamyces sp. JEL0680]
VVATPTDVYAQPALSMPSLGIINKVCLVFPRVFWPVEVERFGILSDCTAQLRGKHFMMVNMYNSTKLPCLMVYYSGVAALDIESKEDMSILKDILNVLARMFPFECPLPYPIETVVTRWASDQYSGGQNVQDPLPLAIDVSNNNNLVFAGTNGKTVDGIYQ